MMAHMDLFAHIGIIRGLQTTTAISGMKCDTMRKHQSGPTNVAFMPCRRSHPLNPPF